MADFYSNQYTNQISLGRSGEPGVVKKKCFEGVTASAATGTIYLIKLPPGKLRVVSKQSGFLMANGAATANVSLGYAAHTASNGAAVAANTVYFKAAGLVNAVGDLANAACFTAPTNGMGLFDTLGGVDLTATITTANTAANGTFSGWVEFVEV